MLIKLDGNEKQLRPVQGRAGRDREDRQCALGTKRPDCRTAATATHCSQSQPSRVTSAAEGFPLSSCSGVLPAGFPGCPRCPSAVETEGTLAKPGVNGSGDNRVGKQPETFSFRRRCMSDGVSCARCIMGLAEPPAPSPTRSHALACGAPTEASFRPGGWTAPCWSASHCFQKAWRVS